MTDRAMEGVAQEAMIVGTFATGFYGIRPGCPERLSPVFGRRGDALAWLAARRAAVATSHAA